MTDEERDRLMAIEDEELRSWIRFIIFQRDVALGCGQPTRRSTCRAGGTPAPDRDHLQGALVKC